MLSYKNENGNWDSLSIRLRGRGNFRRKNCSFTPIRIKIKKKDSEGTIFEDEKNLKLVLPCQNAKGYDRYVYREFLCYKIYEVITPYHFDTRLLQIDLADNSGKKLKKFSVPGFFIEDDDKVADKFGAKTVDRERIHPLQFHDTISTQHDFFQFLIANTDWSSSASHNVSVILLNGSKFVPLAYDFDLAGMVNAPYATINEELTIKSVTERLYRGYCMEESLFENVRQHYLNTEKSVLAVLAKHESYFDEKEIKVLNHFVEDFYSILKNDRTFNVKIVSACRRN